MARPYSHPALRKLPERDRALVDQTNEKALAMLATMLHRATATDNPSLLHGAEVHLVRWQPPARAVGDPAIASRARDKPA